MKPEFWKLQTARIKAGYYVRFWDNMKNIVTGEKMQSYCMKRYETAISYVEECNKAICKYVINTMTA